MRREVFWVCSLLCLVMIVGGSVSSADAAANLVVTSVSGPTEAYLTQTISVVCRVKNSGDEISGGYEVELYLSRDRTVDPSVDRFLKRVAVASGLAPGQSRAVSIKVAVPNTFLDGLSGEYYLGAMVGSNKKASRNKVAVLRYRDNGDGTVSDFKTALMWQQNDDGITKTWSQAMTYCTGLKLAGYDDWVSPPVDVLQTIVDYAQFSPTCNPVFGCRSFGYWSGDTVANSPDFGWAVSFYDGGSYWFYKTNYGYVRCVRGIP